MDITEERLRETTGFATLTDDEIKQILENKEEAKKYADLMNANSQVVKDNITLSQQQKQIKQLKETINELSNEKLEIKEYYKQAMTKLENIGKLEYNDLGQVHDDVEKILKEKK